VDDVERLPCDGVGFSVRVIEPLADLDRRVERHRNGQGALGLIALFQDGAEVLAVDVLHCDEIVVADLAQVGDLADVRMAELDGDLGFVDEHLDKLLILREMGQNPFDDQQSLETPDAECLGLENLRHASDGDPVEKKVFAVNGALETHRRIRGGGLAGKSDLTCLKV